ncbi:MAG: hypothetical protein U0168_29375 [Nannocystaceae bacterium]
MRRSPLGRELCQLIRDAAARRRVAAEIALEKFDQRRQVHRDPIYPSEAHAIRAWFVQGIDGSIDVFAIASIAIVGDRVDPISQRSSRSEIASTNRRSRHTTTTVRDLPRLRVCSPA